MQRWVTAPSNSTYGLANRQPYRSHGSDRRPFAASIENYPDSIRRGNEDYRNDHCRKAKATQVRSTMDAALGDGTIQFVLERSWRRSRARSGACGPAEGYGRVDDVAVRVGIHLVTQRSSQCGMMRNLSYPLTLMSSAAPEQLFSLSSFVQACFQVQLDQGCFTRSNFVFL